MVDTFAALAEPNRYRIVELLRSGPRPVNDIGERLQLTQPQVSKHLRVLKEAGLVDVEPRAQQRLYELRSQPLLQLHNWLERYRELWDERFEELDQVIEDIGRKLKRRRRPMLAGKEVRPCRPRRRWSSRAIARSSSHARSTGRRASYSTRGLASSSDVGGHPGRAASPWQLRR